ncbi:hypothetical protein DUGA6_43810 [Duganella sp. HH105]|nr:hypothetical protein DUGA6_43810 [Duganella sp. HH105]
MVDGARPMRAAIARIDTPATTARETSSRSVNVNANLERCLGGGRMPPVSARIGWIDEWFLSNSWAIICSESPCFQRSHISAFWLSV